jgi:hypothetical protein
VEVAVVEVTPPQLSLLVGETRQLTATPKSGSGVALTARPVSWSSANGNVASVDGAGALTAVGVGSTTITASSEGRNGTVAVEVRSVTPTLASVSPTNATVGGPAFTLTANGSNFIRGAVVRWNGNDRPTTYVSATQLRAEIPAGDLTSAGLVQVSAFNPGAGGGASGAVPFEIRNPLPVLTSLSPANATVGGPAFTLTVNGSNFIAGAVVRWNGNDRLTTFVSATQLRAEVPASDIAASGTGQITVANPAPGGGPSNAIALPVAHPLDRSQIAFVSTRDGNSEIYVMYADGSAVRRLTNNPATDERPAWSPDGTRIAFQSDRDGNWEIYVVGVDGTGLRRLTTHAAIDAEPSWSPDGSRIAFHSNRDGNWEIYVVGVDGTGLRRLTTHAANQRQPSWSPDGSQIAFISSRDGPYQLYVMNADGSGVRRLTIQAAGDAQPRWSPDGRRIVFYSNRDGNLEIYLMNADASGTFRLTNNAAEDQQPSWSPDGSRIAFASDRDGNMEIYTMNADGSSVQRLTTFSGLDWMPAWGR